LENKKQSADADDNDEEENTVCCNLWLIVKTVIMIVKVKEYNSLPSRRVYCQPKNRTIDEPISQVSEQMLFSRLAERMRQLFDVR
jgi:hypothetical protein